MPTSNFRDKYNSYIGPQSTLIIEPREITYEEHLQNLEKANWMYENIIEPKLPKFYKLNQNITSKAIEETVLLCINFGIFKGTSKLKFLLGYSITRALNDYTNNFAGWLGDAYAETLSDRWDDYQYWIADVNYNSLVNSGKLDEYQKLMDDIVYFNEQPLRDTARQMLDNFRQAEGYYFDPLLLDLDGDGVETTSLSTYFDHDAQRAA